jgi:hypothetical protein
MEIALNIKPSGIHPTEGIPQLFTDQLGVIQQYMYNIETQHPSTSNNATTDISPHNHTTTLDIPPDNTTCTIHRNFLQAQHPVIRQLFPDTDTLHPAITQDKKMLKYKHIKDDPEWQLSATNKLITMRSRKCLNNLHQSHQRQTPGH